MKTYHFYGIPEALIGRSKEKASSYKSILKKYSALRKIKSKLTAKKNKIFGFAACDG